MLVQVKKIGTGVEYFLIFVTFEVENASTLVITFSLMSDISQI